MIIKLPVFWPKIDKFFESAFVYSRSMSETICDFILYLQGKNISWIYPDTNSIKVLKNGIRYT